MFHYNIFLLCKAKMFACPNICVCEGRFICEESVNLWLLDDLWTSTRNPCIPNVITGYVPNLHPHRVMFVIPLLHLIFFYSVGTMQSRAPLVIARWYSPISPPPLLPFSSLLLPVPSISLLAVIFPTLRTSWHPVTGALPPSSIILVILAEHLKRYETFTMYQISAGFITLFSSFFLFLKIRTVCSLSSVSSSSSYRCSFCSHCWIPTDFLDQSLCCLFLSSILSSMYRTYDSRSSVLRKREMLR